MAILVINGNTKKSGFIAEALEIVSSYLRANSLAVQYFRLGDAHIEECIGCFHCLRTGECVLKDDMAEIIQAMRRADAIRPLLERSAGKLFTDIGTPPPGAWGQISFALERLIMRKVMFEKHPDLYVHVIKCWQEKGYM